MASAARDIKTLQSISHRVHAAEECHLEAVRFHEFVCSPTVILCHDDSEHILKLNHTPFSGLL